MLQLNPITRGIFRGDKLKIGCTISSDFRPIINFFDETAKIVDKSVFIYYKPLLRKTSYYRFNIKRFLEIINHNVELVCFNLSIKEELLIYAGKGYVVNHKNEILMVLTTKSFENILYYQERNSTDSINEKHSENLVLLISTELIINPLYATFYKKLQKEYISDANKANIPVIFTTSAKIEKLTYSNPFEMKFNTILELQHHLCTNVGSILFKTDEEFENFNPGINNALKNRQKKFVPVIEDEILKLDSLVEQITTRDIYTTNSLYNRHTINQVRNLINSSLDNPIELNYEYPLSSTEVFSNEVLIDSSEVIRTRRSSINVIDDTEEPQIEDSIF